MQVQLIHDSGPMEFHSFYRNAQDGGDRPGTFPLCDELQHFPLPWREIIGMRHFLVHVYWGVDLDRLWRTATEDLPVLVRELERATRHWPLRGAGGPL